VWAGRRSMGGGDAAIRRNPQMAPAWHTRRRQRGKCMQSNMLRRRRAARPRVRLPPPPWPLQPLRLQGPFSWGPWRRRESAGGAKRRTRAEAPKGAAAEPRRVRAERIDELLRASARLIPWPARRPRIRRQADRRPLPPPPVGPSGDPTGIDRSCGWHDGVRFAL